MMYRFIPALALLFALTSGCNNTTLPAGTDQVSVNARGTAKGVADIYLVRGSASRTGLDIAAMKADVDQQVANILALAERLGIAPDAVTADSVSVAPEWQWQPEKRLLGYRVSREVSLRLAGIDAYAGLVTGLARLGINDFSLAGRELSNQQALEHEALAKAMEEARARATVLAQSAGRTLGKVVLISEHGSQPAPRAPTARMAMAESSSYQPGSTDVSIDLSVTFELN